MKTKKMLSFLLVFVLLFTAMIPALTAGAVSASGEKVKAFFQPLIDRITALWNRLKSFFAVRKEHVKNKMNQNAIHMLRSVTNTIGDSFIITTEDGKVIVIDGGHYTETEYFLEYLKAVTGTRKPHIDAWFLFPCA